MAATLWKVTCEERDFPGLWTRWFRDQSVAVGWAPQSGYRIQGGAKTSPGWDRMRRALLEMQAGDHVLVALHGNRVARFGTIIKPLRTDEWDPFVPAGPGAPHGEKGRRVRVQWDLTLGPDDRETAVELPSNMRLTTGELRPTLARVRSRSLEDLKSVMRDPANWVPLWATFKLERALSDYIAAYPHRLEDDLLPHPNQKVRERVFKDRTRLDVLLVDREGKPVVVECKQQAPTLADVRQLKHYLEQIERELGQPARGILVHGGARKLHRDIRREPGVGDRIQLVQHRVEVGFNAST